MVLAGALVTSRSPYESPAYERPPVGDESPGALTTRKLETRNQELDARRRRGAPHYER